MEVKHMGAIFTSIIEEEVRNSYNLGLGVAWSCAARLNRLPIDDLRRIFGISDLEREDIFDRISVESAIKALEEFDKEVESFGITVGDEIVVDEKVTGVVTLVSGYTVAYFTSSGHWYASDIHKCKRTGRHFGQIEEAMQKMKEESDIEW